MAIVGKHAKLGIRKILGNKFGTEFPELVRLSLFSLNHRALRILLFNWIQLSA